MNDHGPRFSAFGLRNYRDIPQLAQLSTEQLFEIEVVARVLPFRTNQYVVDQLIDWGNVPNDPLFVLTFPRKEMLVPRHFDEVAGLIRGKANDTELQAAVMRIRMELNPHPAGQMDHNVPSLNGQRLTGMQHKYRETVLFFPSQGQTCHAYCTFCFRWPQFVDMKEFKFAMPGTLPLIEYVREHPEVTDVLFTGGDPMVMSANVLGAHIDALLSADIPNLHTIRIGTKSLSYWPYRYLTDSDADDVLRLFERIVGAGKHLSLMAHFNHPRELESEVVMRAIERVRNTGAQIRTQSPILRHINDNSDAWAQMWRRQVRLGLVPYYMFVERDTGAQHFFSIPLVDALEIYREASKKMSGLCGTVRGPSMSTNPGKVQILGTSEIHGEKVMVLSLIQSRNPDWSRRPFFAKYNADATWFDELEPAFGENSFFFEDEFKQLCQKSENE